MYADRLASLHGVDLQSAVHCIRQLLSLYACAFPAQWFASALALMQVPSLGKPLMSPGVAYCLVGLQLLALLVGTQIRNALHNGVEQNLNIYFSLSS